MVTKVLELKLLIIISHRITIQGPAQQPFCKLPFDSILLEKKYLLSKMYRKILTDCILKIYLHYK